MSEEEILEFLKDNNENNYQLEISALLATIKIILIQNNITTDEEFQKIQKYNLEEVKKEQIRRMSDEEKAQLSTMKKINDLFGTKLGGLGI